MTTDDHPLEGPDHALYAGAILGLAMKHGVHLTPVADSDGNYTALMEVVIAELPDGVHLTLVVPPPPEGWTLTGSAAKTAL